MLHAISTVNEPPAGSSVTCPSAGGAARVAGPLNHHSSCSRRVSVAGLKVTRVRDKTYHCLQVRADGRERVAGASVKVPPARSASVRCSREWPGRGHAHMDGRYGVWCASTCVLNATIAAVATSTDALLLCMLVACSGRRSCRQVCASQVCAQVMLESCCEMSVHTGCERVGARPRALFVQRARARVTCTWERREGKDTKRRKARVEWLFVEAAGERAPHVSAWSWPEQTGHHSRGKAVHPQQQRARGGLRRACYSVSLFAGPLSGRAPKKERVHFPDKNARSQMWSHPSGPTSALVFSVHAARAVRRSCGERHSRGESSQLFGTRPRRARAQAAKAR